MKLPPLVGDDVDVLAAVALGDLDLAGEDQGQALPDSPTRASASPAR